MSAPAIKSSMPGVGTPTASTGHTMLPMNMVAQKVVPSTDQASSGMKPLQGTNLNYVTLQPASQPLSLIQEHRAPTYQTPFSNNIPTEQQQQPPPQPQSQVQPQPQPQQQPQSQPQLLHKELEQQQDLNKLVQNGTELPKIEKDKQENLGSAIPISTAPIVSAALPTTVSLPIVVPAIPINVSSVPIVSNIINTTSVPPILPAVVVTVPMTTSPVKLPMEQPKVNSSNVDGPIIERHQEPEITPKSKDESTQGKSDNQEKMLNLVPAPIVQNKEENKSPISTPPKEDTTLVCTSPQKISLTPVSSYKSEESSPKTESPLQKSQKMATVKSPEILEKIDIKETKIPVSRPAKRKSRELKEPKNTSSEGGPRSKRNRVQTTPYQSPLPEIAMIVKNLSKPSPKGSDDKLIVFYKNEFLAVRNTEGSFYVCQAMQNIYKSSKRIRIRWLCQDKNNGEIYSPDFYDFTDFDCILTNLNLNKVEKNKYQLTKYELLRTENILKRAIDVEAGVSEKPRVTEEHPDGLDLSLYKDEAQLKKRKGKGKTGKSSKGKRQRKKSNKESSDSDGDGDEDDSEENENGDDSNDSSSDVESLEKKSSPSNSRKGSQIKKRSGNKTAIVQTSVALKGPSRAERALNRSKGPVGPSTSAALSSTSAFVSSNKKSPELKKTAELKKVVTKLPVSSTASTPTQSRAKPRVGAAASASTQDPKTTSRPKRVASTTTIPSSSNEDSSTRKKPRGRA
ncbi:PREDICTED: uncharacterized protein LOC105367613 [Ceratosolen solmsi marchali]|uniref:Uncharacterized protein LOC105367613 n=1 Tax=Ceratosolen solmsi marchali TaxID=326594 RepID=A0AAJ7E1T1_9HYME|nr:PREDICTED: uncharacterized protein LOC105367613 [Ceratosolen solmsi marchali]